MLRHPPVSTFTDVVAEDQVMAPGGRRRSRRADVEAHGRPSERIATRTDPLSAVL
jgi:hypothetical protein